MKLSNIFNFSRFTKLLKPKSYLGIDVGTSSIKIVQLTKKDGKFNLDNYGEIKFFADNMPMEMYQQNSLRMPDKQISDLLKKIIKESGVTATMAAISLPVFSSFSTIIELPPMPKDEMDKAIQFEARQYIPVPINEVSLDFVVIGEKQVGNTTDKKSLSSSSTATLGKHQKHVEVLLVAVPNEIKEKYKHIAELVGLELVAIETETFALARSLAVKNEGSTLIVDIGAHSTDLCIVDNYIVRISHNFEFSGVDITNAYADFTQADFMQAELKKKMTGLHLTPGQMKGANPLLVVVDNIIHETERIISSYSNKSGRPVTSVFLAGGGAKMPGLLERFQKNLKMPVSIGDPFKNIVYPPELSKTLSDIGPLFAVAVGLAMRE